MRRIALILCLVAAVPVAIAATSATADDAREYKVELFNAFGLVEGSDVKVAGVRAGTITDLDINERKRAVATLKLNPGLDSFRQDVRCKTRPQSLIAEYFVDCDPGSRGGELPPGSLIPVERTSSTVQPDLVNNILREPFRDRLRLIINEFGTGLAGRPQDLSRAVHSGAPALRETEEVLKVLARQNRIIRDLNADSEKIIGALARNKRDLSRWVTEARETAQASAERRDDLSATFRKLPVFLEELRPTMARLGEAAAEQTPLFRDLRTSASELERFTRTVGPFSDASLPSLRTLGDAARIGRRALTKGKDEIAELERFGENVQPVSNQLANLLWDLDDRGRATEADPRSPGGKGYTVLEGILNYGYYQTGVLSTFDQYGHSLRLSLIEETPCSEFGTTEYAKNPDGSRASCSAWLGPNQPGLTEQVCVKKDANGHTIGNFCPIPPYGPEAGAELESTGRAQATPGRSEAAPLPGAGGQPPAAGGGGEAQGPAAPSPGKLIPDLPGPLDDVLRLPRRAAEKLPNLTGGRRLGPRAHSSRKRATANDLLDFLFGS